MRLYLLAFFLGMLLSSATALSEGEESVLESMLTNWPDLRVARPPWTSNVSEACAPPSFYGLKCSPDGAHIVALEFTSISLGGDLPDNIDGLSWLKRLTIENGCVSGTIPSSLGKLQLEHLVLVRGSAQPCSRSQVPFSTPIPTSITRMTTLQTLSIAATFDGQFPDLTLLKDLRNIYLEHLPRAGIPRGLPRFLKAASVPESLETITFISLETEVDPTLSFELYLPRLRVIIFNNCRLFSSYIHHWINTTRELTEIRIIASPFMGSVESLNRQVNLTSLVLRQNNVENFPPMDTWNWPKLTELDCQNTNRISIEFTTFPPMPQLRRLSLPSIDLYGTISPSLGNLLQLQEIDLVSSHLKGTLPNELGNLRRLYKFAISSTGDITGTLPSSFGNWTGLKRFQVAYTNLTGTIPASYASWNLTELMLLDNPHLQGTIPDFHFQLGAYVDLSNCNLTGTIPRRLASMARHIDLSANALGLEPGPSSVSSQTPWTPYSLPGFDLVLVNMSSMDATPLSNHSTIFLENRVLNVLDLSFNNFEGPLPLLSPNAPLTSVDLSFNRFTGDVPSGYCGRFNLDLSKNWLGGDLSEFFGRPCTTLSVRLAYNSFNGTIPMLHEDWTADSLDMSHNEFVGTVPLIPKRLGSLTLSNNRLDGRLTQAFVRSVNHSTIQTLDLSFNELKCDDSFPWFHSITHSSLTSLSLQHNSFSCSIYGKNPIDEGSIESQSKLVTLDLSWNRFTSSFINQVFPSLAYLNLARNSFSGGLIFKNFPAITQIELSSNSFVLDASTIRDMPYLSSISVSHNSVFGKLALIGLTNLQVADFSHSDLRELPDFFSVSELFSANRLLLFSIASNSNLGYNSLSNTGIVTSNETVPSPFVGSFCSRLRLFNQPVGTSFHYEQSLFNYEQCYCQSPYFGDARRCMKCPASEVFSSCDGSNLTVARNTFMYSVTDYLQSQNGAPFNTESCYYTPLQTISRKTNCRGLSIPGRELTSSTPGQIIKDQCEPGSSGRLCSRCECHPEKGECYYDRSFLCAKCRRVFPLRISIPISIALLLLVIIISSIIMVIALRSKRTRKTQSWPSLPIYKRIFHRLLHLTSLGTISILIAFLQLTLTFTNWDAYVRVNWLQVLNGSVEGMGLVCFFPFLSHPLASLLVRLFLPFAVVAIIALIVGIAELVSRWIERRNTPTATWNEDDVSDFNPLLLNGTDDELRVDFSARAMFSSLALSAVKFFYFGTALTAHEYLFSVQQDSALSFVRNHPWMPFSDSFTLLSVSIPWIILFDFILPVTFLCLCWKVRRIFYTPDVQVYFGQLFETFSRRCFWWEIVNILRKLLIALFIEAFPSDGALQPGLVSIVLAVVLLVQVWLQPWKRRSENMLDTVSTILLVASLIAVRSDQLEHSDFIIWATFAFCVAFVVVAISTVAFQTFTERTDYHRRLDRYLAGDSDQDETLPQSEDSKLELASPLESTLSDAEDLSTKMLTLN